MGRLRDLGSKQGLRPVVYAWASHDETWEPLLRALSGYARAMTSTTRMSSIMPSSVWRHRIM